MAAVGTSHNYSKVTLDCHTGMLYRAVAQFLHAGTVYIEVSEVLGQSTVFQSDVYELCVTGVLRWSGTLFQIRMSRSCVPCVLLLKILLLILLLLLY